MRTYLILVALACLLLSCKKEGVTGSLSSDKGSLRLKFDNIFASSDLKLNTENYKNVQGESFTISSLSYFVSNIRILTKEGFEYLIPIDSSYFLIKEEDPLSQVVELHNVPAGDYVSFIFTLGVDSSMSTTPLLSRHGVLDPEGTGSDMFIDYHAGYTFLKLKGESPAATTPGNKILYSVGGFGGGYYSGINNIRQITMDAPFEMSAHVRKNSHVPSVHIMVDASKILDGPNNISIALQPVLEPFDPANKLADNYSRMFNVDHIHND